MKKSMYCYLVFLLFVPFFGDVFLGGYLRELCDTGHYERLKKRDAFSIYRKNLTNPPTIIVGSN